MLRRWLFALALCTPACGGMSDHPKVYVDVDFGSDLASVDSAMAAWEPSVHMQPVIVTHSEALSQASKSDSGSIVLLAMPDMMSAPGMTVHTVSYIGVNLIHQHPEDSEMQRAVAHELGHAMGLPHEPNSLMQNSYSGPSTPQCDDFRALSGVLGTSVPAACP